jgi:hypothetical protein
MFGFDLRQAHPVVRKRMRRSFLRTFGQTPQNVRNAWHPLATI